MKIPDPKPGLVVRYGFVWKREGDGGAETAGKSRPCAIVLTTVLRNGQVMAMVCPITHRQPALGTEAVLMPTAVKKRLGLDDAESWIVTHELNAFRWPGPDVEAATAQDFERSPVYGLLPERLYLKVRDQVIAHQRVGRLRIVKRTE